MLTFQKVFKMQANFSINPFTPPKYFTLKQNLHILKYNSATKWWIVIETERFSGGKVLLSSAKAVVLSS